MSKSFDVPALDCRVVKGMVEKLAAAKNAWETHNAILLAAIADYEEYMKRVADGFGVDPALYGINFATNTLEPIPTPEDKQPEPAKKAPDADVPPAPFREADVIPEVKV